MISQGCQVVGDMIQIYQSLLELEERDEIEMGDREELEIGNGR